MTSEGVEMDDMNQNQGNETGGVIQGQSNEAKMMVIIKKKRVMTNRI
jgi:hypothetical protein